MAKKSVIPPFFVGFLSGLWFALGINPKAEIFEVLGEIAEQVSGIIGLRSIFVILPTIIFLFTLWSIYKKKGKKGLLIVAIGFMGGLLVILDPLLSLICILIGVILSR